MLVADPGGRLVLNPRPFEAWALLRENRGDFLKQPAGGDAVIVATGRGDWIGWVDLITEPVDETATRMTAKVINEVAADILCLVEAEQRPSLVRFNTALLDRHYAHAMLVDGNDPRGIDVGLMTTARVTIESVRSHVDDPDPQSETGRALFSRDCPVYQLRLPGRRELFLLLNHFKSQSFSSGDPDPLRRRQATRVREIYDQLRADGADLVAVLGDLNKAPPTTPHPNTPPSNHCSDPAHHWSTPPTCPGSTPAHAPARSSHAACATAWTTFWSHPNSPNSPQGEECSAKDSGAIPTTPTRRNSGRSTPRSPHPATAPPTMPQSGSISISKPSRHDERLGNSASTPRRWWDCRTSVLSLIA
ncbi:MULTISPECIES: endonuclease/exonuclease/phosphatase family protein [Saccharothrix]|uniref:endonuclease/exonuclease/phosphatase family protein n=1 Tax=Saccharothrix TaxID=2071 RepID=UPI000960BE6F|nr:endonuclease/exonuclease/phosphatase family protein [Saccharothrix sp. CB00851]OKI19843.1 hypothetical protein A6A25_38835 [Saccharothrix sp. CB00851]